jgi:cytochrome b561
MLTASFRAWAFLQKIKSIGAVMNNPSARYSIVAIVLHWTMAVLMIYMLFFGEDLIARAQGTFWPSTHASLGFLILLLTFVRLGWRIANPPPPLPISTARWEALASHATHWLFYMAMVGLPLSGLTAFTSHMVKHPDSIGSSIFGLFLVPALPDFGFGDQAHLLHNLGSKAGIFLLFLHVAAALKHQFWNKDNILRRMSPH